MYGSCFPFIILLYNLLAAFLNLKVIFNSLPTEGLCIPPLWTEFWDNNELVFTRPEITMRKAELTSVKSPFLQNPVLYLSCSKLSNAMQAEWIQTPAFVVGNCGSSLPPWQRCWKRGTGVCTQQKIDLAAYLGSKFCCSSSLKVDLLLHPSFSAYPRCVTQHMPRASRLEYLMRKDFGSDVKTENGAAPGERAQGEILPTLFPLTCAGPATYLHLLSLDPDFDRLTLHLLCQLVARAGRNPEYEAWYCMGEEKKIPQLDA